MPRFVAEIDPHEVGLLLPAVQAAREAARSTKDDTKTVLFFDEADALKTAGVDGSDSSDAYANQEVSYLIQDTSDLLFGEGLIAHELTHIVQDGA